MILLILQIALVEGILQAYYRITNGDYLAKRVDLPIFAPDLHRIYRVQSNLDYQHDTNEFSVSYTTDNFGFRTASRNRGNEHCKAGWHLQDHVSRAILQLRNGQ